MEQARSQIIDIILFGTILGFASGILFASLAHPSAPLLICMGAVSVLGFAGFALSKKVQILFLASGILLAAALAGIARSDAGLPDTERLAGSVGSPVTVTGIVADEPSAKKGSQSFTLHAKHLGISVAALAEPELRYGDEVSVTGVLELPENFTTDQGMEFDYVSYLYKDDILYKMKRAHAAVLSRGHGNWVVAHLIPVKNAILRSFKRILPGKEADLLAGLNLGEKSDIDPEFRDALVTTGTIHMIALSGYNVTVIANALRDFFTDILGLAPRLAQVSGAIGIVLFVTMTGLQSSAVRAGIMALIGLFARGEGRTYDAFRALLFSGFCMLLWDPKYLVYDVSFQLSFLATLGIIFLTPLLERALARVPKKVLFIMPLRELMSVTLGAQLGVLPFILYKMGTLSIISLPANILALPAVPYAMALGLLAGLIGSFSVLLAYPVTYVTHLLLTYITGIIRFFAKVPYAAVIIKDFPLWLCLVMYCILIFITYRKWRPR